MPRSLLFVTVESLSRAIRIDVAACALQSFERCFFQYVSALPNLIYLRHRSSPFHSRQMFAHIHSTH